jgi:hypothetical protein
MKKLVNGELIDMTAEEIAERNADYEKSKEKDAQILADKQAKETAKVSGNQKLLDLGLTQAEATALTGYTPPVEE